MTYLIYYISQFFSLSLVNSSKSLKIFRGLPLILMWVLMGLNTSNPDFINYEFTYYLAQNMQFTEDPEIGYLLLEKIGNILGLTFIQFRMITYAIFLMVLFKQISKLTTKYYFVTLFYASYLLFIDTTQMRNFFAMVIVVTAIKYLTSKEYDLAKFVIIILIASSFHITSLAYLLLVFLHNKKSRNIIKVFVLISLLFTGITILNSGNIPFLSSILLATDNEKILRYFTNTTDLGFIYPFVLNLLMVAVSYISYEISTKFNTGKVNEDFLLTKEIPYLVFWICISILMLSPFYVVNINFYRYIRNIVVLVIVSLSISFTAVEKNKLYQIFILLGTTIFILIWFIVDYIILENYTVVEAVFNFNYIF